MKIRSGFVSNSSSSSFILLGVKLTNDSLLNNPEYKQQFDKEMRLVQSEMEQDWENKVNHPDFNKFKTMYEMCKSNNVSIPSEVTRFFGYNFKGVFEPLKPNEKSVLNEMVNEGRFKFPKGVDVITDEGPTYLGYTLATSSDDYFENGSLSMEKLKQYTAELVAIGLEEKDIRIYYGTRAC